MSNKTIFKAMSVQELLTHHDKKVMMKSSVWFQRIEREFALTIHDDCFNVYMLMYDIRRKEASRLLLEHFNMDMTVESLERALDRSCAPIQPERKYALDNYNAFVIHHKALSALGVNLQMMQGYSLRFRDCIVNGVLAHTNHENDTLSNKGLNVLTFAWGGDGSMTRDQKTAFILREQVKLAKQMKLYDSVYTYFM